MPETKKMILTITMSDDETVQHADVTGFNQHEVMGLMVEFIIKLALQQGEYMEEGDGDRH